jgi:hypothetical protein
MRKEPSRSGREIIGTLSDVEFLPFNHLAGFEHLGEADSHLLGLKARFGHLCKGEFFPIEGVSAREEHRDEVKAVDFATIHAEHEVSLNGDRVPIEANEDLDRVVAPSARGWCGLLQRVWFKAWHWDPFGGKQTHRVLLVLYLTAM